MKESELVRALRAVLLFHSASPWTQEKATEWWNLTQTNEATTRTLCDTVRLSLGLLPSCFGDFTGYTPDSLPVDMKLSHEQRNALEQITGFSYAGSPETARKNNQGTGGVTA